MNIANHVERAARDAPDHPAIIFEGKSLSYGVLDVCSAALADALRQSGIGRGDRVALYLPNIPAFALAYLAAQKAGAIAVSINSMFKSDEVAFILADSTPKMLFTTAELLANVARSNCPSIRNVVLCEGAAADADPLERWLSSGSVTFRAETMGADEPAALLYSSGTTGSPKGVTLTHNNIITNIRTAARYSGYEPSDRLALFLPLFHVFGQNYIMNAGFEAGSTLVLFRRFVPEVVLPAIAREQISMFFAVPTIYIALLNANVPPSALATVRYYFSAAATMPQEISRRWSQTYGRPVHEGYGLTECSPFAAYNHLRHHKFGSVGTAVEGFEVKIFDDNEHEVARGQWGEIVIRGPGVMSGYWNRPGDTAVALRGGWLHSGDVGQMDDEGYIFIVDRVKDMINVSGFKVWPAEVENAFYRHPAVKEIAVYGAPDPLKGEQVRAAVVLKDAAATSPQQLIEWCRERLAVYKAPERVDIVAEIPKSATGKILKRVLREHAAANA